MSALQEFVIRRFSGIETRISGTDQDRGTLRVADGVNVTPVGAITFGPKWQSAWGQSTLGTSIATALSGATANKVHFVTVARSGYTFLVAWEKTAGRPRGIFQVTGTSDPSFTSTGSVVITATNTAVYRDKTNSTPWYGSWVDGELWLGNGVDSNLVWSGSSLALLGPSGTPDAMDLSQVAFPACTSWVKARSGVRYGAGNAAAPLRIWASELPNISYPKPQGLQNLTLSYKDIQPNTGATAITALGVVGESLVVHFDVGSPMILTVTGSKGGWAFDQLPMEANASAINPASARDTTIAPFYLGTDLEIYSPKQRSAYGRTDWRDTDIETNRSAGDWNRSATKPMSGTDYFVIYDDKNGRMWAWMQMSVGTRQGVYCYDQRAQAVTGPWRYPDFLSVTQVIDNNLNGCLAVGITRDGVFLWSDLGAIGELPLGAYSDAIGAAYQASATPPSPTAGIPYVGVDTVNGAFLMVLNGQTLYMADAWSDWSASGSVTPDAYYNNARIAVIEFAESNLSDPDTQKEISALRSFWSRNSRVYAYVSAEVNGYRYGAWRGTNYPYESWITGLGGQGGSVKLRMIVVSFNDQPQVNLQSATVEWLNGGLQ